MLSGLNLQAPKSVDETIVQDDSSDAPRSPDVVVSVIKEAKKLDMAAVLQDCLIKKISSDLTPNS